MYVDVPGDVGVDVVPGSAATLLPTVDSSTRDGSTVRASIRAVDRYGNVSTGYTGSVTVALNGETLAVVDFASDDAGVRNLVLPARRGRGFPVRRH